MTRTVVSTRNFNADANGAFPAGFTDLNSFDAVVTVSNPGAAGVVTVPYSNVADARDTGTFTDDQYSQIAVTTLSGATTNFIGVGLRFGTGVRGAANVTGYRVKAMADSTPANRVLRVDKVSAGTESLLGATHTTTIADGDVLSAECTGQATTSIGVYLNGVLQFTVTDSSSPILTGNPGLCGLTSSGSATGDLYEAGNVASADTLMAQCCL